ncbi:hypothetical protein [Streptomyces sp. SLBN-118]|uniref:hypothetical protein n=1 Tax=Streptomyces sp. SLBN-118 TaxID=2768454 RepID=UPI0021B39701|nr:hypothetical protein [Streptomyces sp. SLBN-118]
MFATEPQIAATLLTRARDLGIQARWLAGDEVYGGRKLRRTAHSASAAPWPSAPTTVWTLPSAD